jgi:hypothetical protein
VTTDEPVAVVLEVEEIDHCLVPQMTTAGLGAVVLEVGEIDHCLVQMMTCHVRT